MACYDCKTCNLHHSEGGKCLRFEYDCPFNFYKELSGHREEMEDILLLLQNIIDANDKIQKILDSIHVYGIRTLDSLNNDIEYLQTNLKSDLGEEWEEINRG